MNNLITMSSSQLRGPLLASFKGEFPFDEKTRFETVNGCAK